MIMDKRQEGPSTGWGRWRQNRDKKIAKPQKNKGAQMMHRAAQEKKAGVTPPDSGR